MDNQTSDTYFYILAFGSYGRGQIIPFGIFLLLYLICLLWNINIIVLISTDSHLQTPMYFFLRSLSLVDICYISVTLPKLLHIFLKGDNTISFTHCFAQFYFFTAMASTETLLLTVMAYDRYVAICKALHYPLLMKKMNCIIFVAGCWVSGYSNSLFLTTVASKMSFCSSKMIDQLYCDIKPMLEISCGNTATVEVILYLEILVMGFCPFLCIMMSYFKIISNVLQLHSRGKRRKTFSTCSSHLTIIICFYGTLFFVYMMPSSTNFKDVSKVFSSLFLVVIPTLNPLIYSLRNRDMKIAFQKFSKLCGHANNPSIKQGVVFLI